MYGQILLKIPDMKFYENLSHGSHPDTCKQTDG
jgi:hypothetical protein